METLDTFVNGLGAPHSDERRGFSKAEAALFLSGLQKLSLDTAAFAPDLRNGDLEAASDYFAQERAARSQQAMNEATHLRVQMEAMRQGMTASQQQLLMAQQQADALTAQLDEAQNTTAMAQEQSSMAMQEATMAQQQAAQHADAKMRLAMRIQQFRQQLADLVASDPVQEEGAMEAGMPVTDTTSQQDASAMSAPSPAASDPAQPAGGDPTQGQAAATPPQQGASSQSPTPAAVGDEKKEPPKSVQVKVGSRVITLTTGVQR